jgi:TRAP-type uncharacterized transport system fused permease subunit
LAGFAIAAAGWIVEEANPFERLLAAAAGIALMAPLHLWQGVGLGLLLATIVLHWSRLRLRAKTR